MDIVGFHGCDALDMVVPLQLNQRIVSHSPVCDLSGSPSLKIDLCPAGVCHRMEWKGIGGERQNSNTRLLCRTTVKSIKISFSIKERVIIEPTHIQCDNFTSNDKKQKQRLLGITGEERVPLRPSPDGIDPASNPAHGPLMHVFPSFSLSRLSHSSIKMTKKKKK